MDEFVTDPTPEQAFAFMLHDRIMNLERRLADMEPRQLDPRIKLVKRKRFPLLKIHSRDELDVETWIRNTVETIGKSYGNVFGIACQEYSLAAKAYVVESLFDVGDVEHDVVATAALKHAPDATLVEVHDVMNSSWFGESIASCSYCLSTYDPETKTTHTTVERLPHPDSVNENKLWYALNGWLTSVIDGVDIHNTRAFDALSALIKLQNYA